MQRSGFTLIELSIVLVIIGLMVGAIVGGKALVHQANLQSVVRDFNSCRTAVNAFINQYNAIPGDFNEAEAYWGASVTDNGDNSGNLWCAGHYCPEWVLAWHHLYLAGILPQSYTGVLGAGTAANPWYKPGINIPKSRILDGAGVQILLHSGHNALRLAKSESDGQAFIDPVLIPKDCVNLDKKLDDGDPAAGKFICWTWNPANLSNPNPIYRAYFYDTY